MKTKVHIYVLGLQKTWIFSVTQWRWISSMHNFFLTHLTVLTLKKIILTLIEKEEIGLQDKDLSFNSDGCLQMSQISENLSNFTKAVLLTQFFIPDLDKIFALKNILCSFHKYQNF